MHVLVTGGTGFLGQHVCRVLRERGHQPLALARVLCDLRDRRQVASTLATLRPDAVIHLAATCGGIGANRSRPVEFLVDNALMGLHVLEEARLAGVQKVVCAGSVCSYPKHCPTPFREDDLWNGYPEETNAPYGMAKRLLLTQAHAYRQQYGFNTVTLIPVNLFGPGDNFDPATSHVIPALIHRAIQARIRGDKSLTVWGTGKATREFLYVADAAHAFVRALESYDGPEPINLAGCGEWEIGSLARLICGLCGFLGELRFDFSQPDGQPRRVLDGSRARRLLQWHPTTSMLAGLGQTIAWYEKECLLQAA